MRNAVKALVVAAVVAAVLVAGCGTQPDDVADTTRIDGPSSEAQIALADGAACRAGAPAPGRFTESAKALGIDFVHEAQSEAWPENPTGIIDFAGAAIADIDGDGELDLYLTNAVGPDGIYLTGGRGPAAFEAASRTVGPTGTNSVILVDVDGDGDPDAAVTTMEDPYLLYNDGTGNFDRADLLNHNPVLRDDIYYASFGISAGDLDGDGRLDLVVANHLVYSGENEPGYPARQWLMMSRGDGTFDDQSDLLPEHEIFDWTFLTSLTDFDDDGDLDLYMVNDTWSLKQRGLDPNDNRKIGSRLYRNDGVVDGKLKLVDVTEQSGADVKISAMGVAVGDYDNDGKLDAYVTSALPYPNVMLKGRGDLTFEDATFDSGAQVLDNNRTVGWGAIFLDADADGWEDLFVTHGYAPDKPELGFGVKNQRNVLMHNKNGEFWEEEAGVEGPAISRSPVVGDLNRDGFVDLVVANVGSAPYIYLNGCDDRPWLTVRLRNHLPNRDAIGARIRVSAGGLNQQRRIQAGSDGLYGSSAPEAYFGFPPGTTEVRLSVRWPDGSVSTFESVPTRKLATISRN